MNRRTLLKLAAGAAATAVIPATSLFGLLNDDSFIDTRRSPDAVSITTEAGTSSAKKGARDRWEADGIVIQTKPQGDVLAVTLSAPRAAVKSVQFTWSGKTGSWQQVLGDHWERSYGDLQWRTPDPDGVYPWYLLAHTQRGTHAVGVRTQPAAFCSWRCEADGLTLVCDVRSGGVGVALGDRTLHVCDVTARRGVEDESAFAATVAFCAMLCPKPRLADHVVYGANDWYYAYGKNTPAGLIADAELLSQLSTNSENRPYAVIDDGWQTKTTVEGGQWSASRPSFGSMTELAAKMAAAGTRPGIWMRPLIDEVKAWPEEWHLPRDRNFLDPTRPEVKEIVAADIRRLCGWGFKLIKHDFSTIDILGRWGKDMRRGDLTAAGWSFSSRDKTTAEVINDLYQTMRAAAGDNLILGCNTVSHLSAGVFELNRIGDDTSGNEWHRNPQMGVNTLAFRAAHQGAFYGADADCCPVTKRLEWKKAKQWLDLVAHSGTPLFVSVDRSAVTPEIWADLERALTAASKKLPLAEPLDWMGTATPTMWKLPGRTVTYDWS